MAVFDQTYGNYRGSYTPEWSRFLIVPRYAYRSVFKSKLFTGFYAACFIYPLVASILIYLHHNSTVLRVLNIKVEDLLAINARFFLAFVVAQTSLAWLVTLFIGPGLVAGDVTNNALPLYFCRPFSRTEYVLGKMSVLTILLSSITWVPGLLLFIFQGSLEGGAWLAPNWWVSGAIFLGSWVWMLTLVLLTMAYSAWIKRKLAVTAALIGTFMVPAIFGAAINEIFSTRLGGLLSLNIVTNTILDNLFRRRLDPPYPVWSAWTVLVVVWTLCLVVLSVKLRAYEEVK